MSGFIGRDTELQAVAKQLGAGRIVSIVGVGGVGKTLLALHAASDLQPATLLGSAEIVARLDRQFRSLTGGGRTRLERRQTLRAAIDWSYDLITQDEQTLLNRLSVCVAGSDLTAATAIATGADVDEFDAIELLGSPVATYQNEPSRTA